MNIYGQPGGRRPGILLQRVDTVMFFCKSWKLTYTLQHCCRCLRKEEVLCFTALWGKCLSYIKAKYANANAKKSPPLVNTSGRHSAHSAMLVWYLIFWNLKTDVSILDLCLQSARFVAVALFGIQQFFHFWLTRSVILEEDGSNRGVFCRKCHWLFSAKHSVLYLWNYRKKCWNSFFSIMA